MKSTVRKIWNIVTMAVVIIVVLLAILLVGMRVLGFQVFSVLSGSMEPTYLTGSIIYVKKVDHRTLAAGDPITFMANESTVVTHRITEVVPDEKEPETLWFRTKGDANAQEDTAAVHYKNVIGKPVFSIPYLGYVADYIQTPPGLYVALGGGAVLLILTFLPSKKKKARAKESLWD